MMVRTQPQKQTFAEYLVHQDDTENHYKPVDGVFVPLPPEFPENDRIAQEL